MRRSYIDGAWVEASGEGWVSRSPADREDVLGEFVEDVSAADAAVEAARRARPAWEALGLTGRAAALRLFERALDARVDAIADVIAREVGKPRWEALGEAKALGAKVGLTLGAGMEEVRERLLPGSQTWMDGGFRYRPLGVCAVLGPFNFPLHLANGHILAALAMGNAVVFKPSELSPACAELYMEAAHEAGLPPGVLNMVQGRRAVGERLVVSPHVQGILFTGSVATGLAIRRATVEQPWKLLALELGGKNTAIVLPGADLERAAHEVGTGALLTAGQRCTATSRLVVAESLAEGLIARLARIFRRVEVGHPLEDATFMGPLIHEEAVSRFLAGASSAAAEGMEAVVAPEACEVRRGGRTLPGCYVRPALWRATRRPDGQGVHDSEEIFGPDLVVHVVEDGASDEEIASIANATPYGLAMSIFSGEASRLEGLAPRLECGILNLNRGTVGASSVLPFGGVKMSGNHRAAASLATRYCAWPVSTLRDEVRMDPAQRMARFPGWDA